MNIFGWLITPFLYAGTNIDRNILLGIHTAIIASCFVTTIYDNTTVVPYFSTFVKHVGIVYRDYCNPTPFSMPMSVTCFRLLTYLHCNW